MCCVIPHVYMHDHADVMVCVCQSDLLKKLLTYLLSKHIQTKINKAYMMLGIIQRNLKRLTVPTYVLLYASIYG